MPNKIIYLDWIKRNIGSSWPGPNLFPETEMGERLFTEKEFMTGLSVLYTRIRSTSLRSAQGSINLIVTGGAASVLYLHNRASIYDIDYAVEPLGFKLIEVSVLTRLGWDVAREFHWPLPWFSGDVAGFLDDRGTFLSRLSVEQDVKLFNRDLLKVYAVKFEWSLTQKLIHVTGEKMRPRLEQRDWNDAVSLANVLEMRRGRPLTKEILSRHPVNVRGIPVETIEGLAMPYAERYPECTEAIVL